MASGIVRAFVWVSPMISMSPAAPSMSAAKIRESTAKMRTTPIHRGSSMADSSRDGGWPDFFRRATGCRFGQPVLCRVSRVQPPAVRRTGHPVARLSVSQGGCGSVSNLFSAFLCASLRPLRSGLYEARAPGRHGAGLSASGHTASWARPVRS